MLQFILSLSVLHAAVHSVAVCTSLGSLKHTLDDVISTEAVRCMERRNGKIKIKIHVNLPVETCAELHATSALSSGKPVDAS
jgi:hypothetical protein